jgi:hypothetical chaperone protein
MGLKIGLDFGTSNSGAAIYDGHKVHLLPVDRSNITPEVVKTILYITKEHQSFIGQEAVELYYRHNVNRVRRYVKKWAGELEYVGAEMHYVRDTYVYVDELKPGRLLQYLKTALRKQNGPAGYSGTQIFDRYYAVGDLIREYLHALKSRVERELGEEVDEATIGRPVHFSGSPETDERAQETLHQAALAAGFNKVRFELEPVAAAHYFEKSLLSPKTALIFDFGGGTLDVAIMRLGDPMHREVLASSGIDIAGSDFDRAIIEKRMLQFFGSEKIDHQPELLELIHTIPDWIALPELSTPINRNHILSAIQKRRAPIEMRRLLSLIFNDLAFTFYNHIETAKIALSEAGATIIELNEKDLDIWDIYTRWQFEKDIEDFRRRIEQFLFDTLKESRLEPGQIDVLVKTGGSSGIPIFSKLLAQIFGGEKIVESDAFNSVTAGLAIRAFEG